MKLDAINATNVPITANGRPRDAPPAPVEARAAAAAGAAAVQVVDEGQVKRALEAANRMMQSLGSSLKFSVDQGTGRTLIQVIDTSTHQLIRQIPSEEMLAISRALDRLQGLLLRQRA